MRLKLKMCLGTVLMGALSCAAFGYPGADSVFENEAKPAYKIGFTAISIDYSRERSIKAPDGSIHLRENGWRGGWPSDDFA